MMPYQSQDKWKTFGNHLITCQLLQASTLPKLSASIVLPPGFCKCFAHSLNHIFIFSKCYNNLCILKILAQLFYPYVAFSFSSKLVVVFTKFYKYSAKDTSFQWPSRSLVGCGTFLKSLIWSELGLPKKG